MVNKIPILTNRQKWWFWSKVLISGPNDCWLWTGTKVEDGYGQIGLETC